MGTLGYLLSLAFINLLLPRYVSVEEFGSWQLFQFYVLYLGYVTFGYSDGLLLRTAGNSWNSIVGPRIKSGLLFLALSEVVVFGVLLLLMHFLLSPDSWNLLALGVLGVSFFILRVTLTFLFQATGRSRDVMFSMLIERLVLLAAFLVFFLWPHLGLLFLISGDVLGKLIGLLWSVYAAADIFEGSLPTLTKAWASFLADCRAGMFVVLSNLSSLSLNGSVRAITGAAFGLAAFGQISLALQISTLLLVFVNAVAVAIFPNLRSTASSEWPRSFTRLSTLILPGAILTMILGVPLTTGLRLWAPEYSDAAILLALLMPVGYFEVKTRGLLAVFLKAARLERELFKANLFATVAGAALCLFFAFGVRNLHVAALSLVLALWMRSVLTEVIVRRTLRLEGRAPVAIEAGCVLSYYVLVQASTSVGLILVLFTTAIFMGRLAKDAIRNSGPNHELVFVKP